jgi:hypothetical protein
MDVGGVEVPGRDASASAGGGGGGEVFLDDVLYEASFGFGGLRVVTALGSTEMRSPGCNLIFGSEICTPAASALVPIVPPVLTRPSSLDSP